MFVGVPPPPATACELASRGRCAYERAVIDLHSHTQHSDGERSPTELLTEAAAAGVQVLAVTDHDTVSGIADCRAAAERVGVRLVPGIELSSELHGREVHILGHFLDPASGALLKLATGMLAERRERMERMVILAQGMGFAGVTMERVIACSGGENLGRPHLARVLVECGHASSVKDAFDKFLRSRGPLWVDRRRLSVPEAVELIRGASGTSSVAHPGANGVSRQELKVMADAGPGAVDHRGQRLSRSRRAARAQARGSNSFEGSFRSAGRARAAGRPGWRLSRGKNHFFQPACPIF